MLTMDLPTAVTLPGTPSSVLQARRYVHKALELYTHLAEDAALAVSELVSNAIVHTRSGMAIDGRVELSVAVVDGVVRVEVRDQGTINGSKPSLRVNDNATDPGEHGNGLRLVMSVVSRWGVELLAGGGSLVWAELDI